MIYLVSYDLNNPGKDYQSLYTELKKAKSWWHYLDSTWIISTSETVESWHKRIRNVIDSNDHFIIVDLTGKTRNGWLPEKAWDWIRKHDEYF